MVRENTRWVADVCTGFFCGSQCYTWRCASTGQGRKGCKPTFNRTGFRVSRTWSLSRPAVVRKHQPGAQVKRLPGANGRADGAAVLGPRERVVAFPLLSDAYKSIRMEAARILAALPAGDLPLEQKTLLDNGVDEYIAAQQFNADRPEAQVNLGNLYSDLSRYDEAETAYQSALELQSQFEPAYANLAQFYSNTGREQAALAILDRGLATLGNSALLHHAKGLSLIRLQQTDKSMESLAKAARLGAENPRYAYVFAIALNSTGRTDMALGELATAHRSHPQTRIYCWHW